MIIFASQICNVIYNVADDQIASRAQRERRLFLLDIVDSCLDIFYFNDLTWICLIYPPLYVPNYGEGARVDSGFYADALPIFVILR